MTGRVKGCTVELPAEVKSDMRDMEERRAKDKADSEQKLAEEKVGRAADMWKTTAELRK